LSEQFDEKKYYRATTAGAWQSSQLLMIKRRDLMQSLMAFPEIRKNMVQVAIEKLKYLHKLKQEVTQRYINAHNTDNYLELIESRKKNASITYHISLKR
jgi:hypothetical protein